MCRPRSWSASARARGHGAVVHSAFFWEAVLEKATDKGKADVLDQVRTTLACPPSRSSWLSGHTLNYLMCHNGLSLSLLAHVSLHLALGSLLECVLCDST